MPIQLNLIIHSKFSKLFLRKNIDDEVFNFLNQIKDKYLLLMFFKTFHLFNI